MRIIVFLALASALSGCGFFRGARDPETGEALQAPATVFYETTLAEIEKKLDNLEGGVGLLELVGAMIGALVVGGAASWRQYRLIHRDLDRVEEKLGP